MKCSININSKIINDFESSAIQRAVKWLYRDLEKTCKPTARAGMTIRLCDADVHAECFLLRIENGELLVCAGDELGFVYGLLEISRGILGVHDFWFWNDQHFVPMEGFELSEKYTYQSSPFLIRYRGWFVNDEVLIHAWRIDGRKEGPWEMVFEALLRCGGNMVIPGTDRNSKYYAPLASSMGLYITHHHAEPMGAEMFARAYPDLNPSYDEHPELFHKLWHEGIVHQQNQKVVWNLGFRGQGDCPFWETDPAYSTPESRGKLISDLILMQYNMVKEQHPDADCCTNLYGETMELYQQGHIVLPDDVIRIWADNGYGKMVSRRQDNHNPRISSLPMDSSGKHGIYYHVSFYDLQAANHITGLPNPPEFVKAELVNAMQHGVLDYWIINCSNVKPHTYYLDFIAQLWHSGDVDIDTHRIEYTQRYYGTNISKCLQSYFDAAVSYGEHQDEKAGEQFVNHVPRILICQFMKDRFTRARELLWATDANDLEGQVDWYRKLCQEGVDSYEKHLLLCEETAAQMETGKILFEDSILLHAKIYAHCYRGALLTCDALKFGAAEDWQKAFFYAGKARKEYLLGNEAMRQREHDVWSGFYANECQADVKQTAWVLEALMGYLRCQGDGPHYYSWQRQFLYSQEDRRVTLLLNNENHLTDLELFLLMEKNNQFIY